MRSFSTNAHMSLSANSHISLSTQPICIATSNPDSLIVPIHSAQQFEPYLPENFNFWDKYNNSTEFEVVRE